MFEELKRYVKWSGVDEAALRALHPVCTPELVRIADLFYKRILEHDGARVALEGGESQVGRLKVTLVAWMDRLLQGPWDEDYFALRCRIGRVHVRIALPQHYMFGAMNVIRQELKLILGRQYADRPVELGQARDAVDKILDLELAIMLHTYREDLEAQQNRVERLSTFGQLIGAIGHELRNPLGVIESSLYILKGRAGSDERMLKHIGRIGDQVTLANSTIAGLIDMIRDKPLLRDPVQLRTLVDAALGTLTVPPGVVVKIEGMDSLPEVSGDATQLRQLLRNLLDNALHAVGKAGEISIIGRTVAGGGQVEVAISDSGPGVDPAIRKRLFEPLISAKAAGIGLGLSLVKRFVERHGGTIVYAPEGKGARFVVKLPVNGGANA